MHDNENNLDKECVKITDYNISKLCELYTISVARDLIKHRNLSTKDFLMKTNQFIEKLIKDEDYSELIKEIIKDSDVSRIKTLRDIVKYKVNKIDVIMKMKKMILISEYKTIKNFHEGVQEAYKVIK